MATIIQNLLSVEDFAKLKGVTPQTVYNWIKEGRVKRVEFLKKAFVDKSTYKEA